MSQPQPPPDGPAADSENPFQATLAPPRLRASQGLSLGCLWMLAIPAAVIAFLGGCTGTFFLGLSLSDYGLWPFSMDAMFAQGIVVGLGIATLTGIAIWRWGRR